MAKKTKTQIRDVRVKKEYDRLKELFKDLPTDTLKVVDGLIVQAARARVNLDDNWEDICENGDYELFTQSDKTEPYERERPVARLYNTRDQSYQRIIRQLTDLLPEEEQEEVRRSATDLL